MTSELKFDCGCVCNKIVLCINCVGDLLGGGSSHGSRRAQTVEYVCIYTYVEVPTFVVFSHIILLIHTHAHIWNHYPVSCLWLAKEQENGLDWVYFGNFIVFS